MTAGPSGTDSGLAGPASPAGRAGEVGPGGLLPWREQVRTEWIDYNGHLTEVFYVYVFGHATDWVMAQLGMTADYLERTSTSLFTLEAHVRYLDQVRDGALLEVVPRIVGATDKLVWIWHEMYAEGRLRGTEEVLMLHVDTAAERGAPMPEQLRDRVHALRVDPPADAGRAIGIRPRGSAASTA